MRVGQILVVVIRLYIYSKFKVVLVGLIYVYV